LHCLTASLPHCLSASLLLASKAANDLALFRLQLSTLDSKECLYLSIAPIDSIYLCLFYRVLHLSEIVIAGHMDLAVEKLSLRDGHDGENDSNSVPTRRILLLVDLPVEILAQICSSLCLHCRTVCVPEASPVEVDEGFEDQTTLSRLSQSCGQLRDIAQPILFHWFCGVDRHIRLRRRLAAFVHTLIRRPHLAQSVKTLVLYTPQHDHDSPSTHEEVVAGFVKDLDGTFRSASLALGDYFARLGIVYLQDFQEMAIGLTPNVSQLSLERQYETRKPERCWKGWSHSMPRLTYIAFPGLRAPWVFRENSYHIKEAMKFLSCAPNLETLVAADCDARGGSFPPSISYADIPWDIQIPRLRKLSLNGVDVEQLADIIRGCPLLEELEFFHDASRHRRTALDPAKHLDSVVAQLRRLCYSIAPMIPEGFSQTYEGDGSFSSSSEDEEGEEEVEQEGEVEGGADGEVDAPDREGEVEEDNGNNDEVDTDYGFLFWELRFYDFLKPLSFASFTALEQLEVEQYILQGREWAGAEEDQYPSPEAQTAEFVSLLPPSLKHLRIGCIYGWKDMCRSILGLAKLSSRFPHLRKVTLEGRQMPPRDLHSVMLETLRREAGITLSVFLSPRSPRSRGMLLARPGEPPLTLLPVV